MACKPRGKIKFEGKKTPSTGMFIVLKMSVEFAENSKQLLRAVTTQKK